MHTRDAVRRILILAFVLSSAILSDAQTTLNNSRPDALPPRGYSAEFVSTAAGGVALNAAGDVAGASYPDPGCGWQCLPPVEHVVWRNGVRIVLPMLPGHSSVTLSGMNAAGWVTGYAGQIEFDARAVVWKPRGNTYDIIDLGVLPETAISYAVGIDDLGRVVGYSSSKFFPPTAAPFMWSEATGMVDLSQQGFPNESPLAISPGGTVALSNSWYRLGEPGSVVTLAPPPSGFRQPGRGSVAINDAGDQARFLLDTTGEALAYLFRYDHEGAWQQIGFIANGHLSSFGVGSINPNGDITATDQGLGVVAYGPDGVEQSLTSMLSPAYQSSAVTSGGPMNSAGQILAEVMIGRSQRLMRLLPLSPCASICMKVNALQVTGTFINDPHDPGHCTPDAKVHVETTVQITTWPGAPLANVIVQGRFLDDYWLNEPVAGRTNGTGMVTLVHDGLACTGAVAFLTDNAIAAQPVPKGLDKTTGILTGYTIPLP